MIEDTPSDVKAANYVSSLMMGIGMAVNIVSMAISFGSVQSLFSSANFLQLLMLLPLFRTYMPKVVVGFYYEIGWVMFGMDFLKIDVWPGYSTVSSTFSDVQSDQFMYLIGIEDSSSLMNLTSMLILFLVFICVHPLLGCVYYFVKDKKKPNC